MSARGAFAISLVQQYASVILQLVGSMVVSRLLTPEEFGIFSLAMSVSIMAQVFRDLGVGQYLIQEEVLTTEKVAAAQTVLLSTSIFFGACLIGLSGTAAQFYDEPGLEPLLQILGVNFFLLPVGAVTFAMLRRNLEFQQIAIIGVLSVMGNTVITIYLAFHGQSYLSLGWGVLAGSLITATLCVVKKPLGMSYLPGLLGVTEVLRYSSMATYNSLLESLSERMPSLLLGKASSMGAVGLYERAVGIADLFDRLVMQAAWSVSLPILAGKVRAGLGIEEDYLHAVSLITGAGFLAVTFLAIAAEPVVYILFGDQWSATVPIIQILCLGKAIGMPNYLSTSLIISHGHIRKQTILTTITKGGLIVGACLGLKWGLEGVVIGLTASSAVSSVCVLFFIREYVSVQRIVSRTLISFLPAAVLGGAMSVAFTYLEKTPLNWFFTSLLGALAWLAAIIVLRHPLLSEGIRILEKIK
jgi:O-antigen/teichoic acid export membrane protein